MADFFNISRFMNECPMLYSYFEFLVGWKTEDLNKKVLLNKAKKCNTYALIKLIAMDHKYILEPFASRKRAKLLDEYKDLNATPGVQKKAKTLVHKWNRAEIGLRPAPGREGVKLEVEILEALVVCTTYEILKVKKLLKKKSNIGELFEKNKEFWDRVKEIYKKVMQDDEKEDNHNNGMDRTDKKRQNLRTKQKNTLPFGESLDESAIEEIEESLKVVIKSDKPPSDLAIRIVAKMNQLKETTLQRKILQELGHDLRHLENDSEIDKMLVDRGLDDIYKNLKEFTSEKQLMVMSKISSFFTFLKRLDSATSSEKSD